MEYEGSDQRPVFRVKEPIHSCIVNPNLIKISIDAREYNTINQDFEIKGYFPDRACSIIDSKGNVIAQVISLKMCMFLKLIELLKMSSDSN